MIKNYTVLAIIPARGGSKRIPNKNIKPLLGKPLIAYSIEEAKKSKYIDRVIVSTDSESIKDASIRFGAEVPFLRPADISGDTSVDFDLFHHALLWFEKEEKYLPDIIVQLRPTSPFRVVKNIDDAIELLAAHPDADSVRTVTKPEQHPYKMYRYEEGRFLKPLLEIENEPEAFNLPEQKLPACVKHVGYVDCVWRKTLIEKKKMSGDKMLPLYIPNAVSGINTPEDWEYYEYLIHKRNT